MDDDISAYLEAQVDKKAVIPARSEEVPISRSSRDDRSRSPGYTRDDRDYRRRDDDRDYRRRDEDRDYRRRDRDRRSRSRSRGGSRRSRDKDDRRRRDREASPERAAPSASIPEGPPKTQFEINQEREALRRQKEIDDLTKDQRTIFVGQLTMKVVESQLTSFFGQLGLVKNVIMVRDKNTGKHKGFAYVEMNDLDSIPNCLLLNNIVPDFQKFPILVKASEAEKNFVAKKETPMYDASGMSDSRLYVGNLHVNVTEAELKPVLAEYGPVDMVSIHRDELGVSKGFAFCRFSRADDAATAMSKLSGYELMGKAIRLGYITEPQSSSVSSAANSAGSANWKLDDDEGAGLQMNAHSRAMLMNKLGQAAGLTVPKPVMPPAGLMGIAGVAPIAGAPTRCFRIWNMFDPATETEPNWDLDVKEDVTEECSKFGAVEHCYVENKKPGGIVFVRFTNVDSSRGAAVSLHGRFFAGRQITVEYVDPAKYSTLF